MNPPRHEILNFRIGLSGTFWDRIPKYAIYIDDVLKSEGFVDQPQQTIKFVEFEHTVEIDSKFYLKIKFLNKDNSQTIVSVNDGKITQDMLLNIESIEIEDIELENLKWTASKFIPDDPKRPTLTACNILGWNGSFTMEFTTPFYLWLLEKM